MVTREKSMWVYIGQFILTALQKAQNNLTICVYFCYSCDTLFTLSTGGHQGTVLLVAEHNWWIV